MANTTNVPIEIDKNLKACDREQSLIFTLAPSNELAEALQEVENYKN